MIDSGNGAECFFLILAGEVHDDIIANPPSSEEYPLQRQAY
jgi:hypothetical protein